MATKRLRMNLRPGVTLHVDGITFQNSRRSTVTVRNYSSIRWSKAAPDSNRSPNQPPEERPQPPEERWHNPDWPT